MEDLVQNVCSKLKENHVTLRDVRVNGGFATYIVGDEYYGGFGGMSSPLGYNDIDLIFSVQLESEEQLLRLKDYVVECLLAYLPAGINRNKLGHGALTEAYVSKMAKVWQPCGDKWSLVTLSNNLGMNLELKFVDTMKRKYQFSVDSFQIIIDSLMKFYEISSEPMNADFYPTVIAESVYGDYHEALYHVNNRLICTQTPQDIRGGGLLKYCELLARGYQPAFTLSEIENLERLMCSRFFIDYSDISSQYQKLDSYLLNHFGLNYGLMLCYLHELYRVVNDSTVCLMGHERRQALQLIVEMSYPIHIQLAHINSCYPAGSTDCKPTTPDYGTTTASYPFYNPAGFMQSGPAAPSAMIGYPTIQHVY